MIRRLGPVLLLILSLNCRLGAQEGFQIEKQQFIPDRYYVGDRVELRLRISLDAAANDSASADAGRGLAISQPLEMPAVEWVKFEETMVVPYAGETEIRLVFIPFRPGTRTLPRMVFGDIELNDVKIHTSSLVAETGRNFAAEKGQVALPGSELFLALVISVGILVPIIVFLILSRGRAFIADLRRRYSEAIPSRRLGKVLDKLLEGTRSISHREYYITLSEAIRDFLTGKSSIDFSSLTSDELSAELVEVIPPAGIRAAIMTILRRADGVKFAGWGIDHLTREKDAATARAMAKDVDRLFAMSRKEKKGAHVDV